MQLKVKPVEPSHRENLLAQLYTEAEIEVLQQYQTMMDATSSVEAGQELCNWVSNRINVALTFLKWHNGNVVAVNKRGVRHAIIGSWWLPRFVLRGVVKERRKGKGFYWLCNGQADKNAIQVAHYAEQESVPFPEFEPIIAAHIAALEAAAERRAERVQTYILVDSRTYQRTRLGGHDTERELSGRAAAELNLELPNGYRYIEPAHVKP